jgi:hypothetical protein
MKKFLLLVAVATFCVSLLIFPLGSTRARSSTTYQTRYLKSLNDSQKFRFFVLNNAKKVFKVSGTYFIEENLRGLYKEEWFRGEVRVRKQLENFCQKWPEREALFLIVNSPPMTVSAWEPEKFLAFEQDFVFYEIEKNEIIPLSNDFVGGKVLDSFNPEYGYVVIPEEIDTERPFKIWYGRYSYASGSGVVALVK